MNLKQYIQNLPKGGAGALANEIGISPSYLSQMASGVTNISPENAVKIETATKGKVSRCELLPDKWEAIWPELSQQHLFAQRAQQVV
ncbi:hypothetical protein GCM10009007_03070 [Formosimonas limnophila]|uniref:HTH cro/C1-type domain-containing protein n=1 Tax=Formosimonas limnophila TaxID=1384487 RepID=A0A8J3CFY6_9BURK|nr:YdaS family helix-turn-helix protein [Formosimonas limnophila]GHA66014.1 hypothetical protein GCM10009007_03070 [Formosimonas limnophila]